MTPETPLTHQTLMMMMMMMTKMVFETLIQYGHLMWLIPQEDYIKSVDSLYYSESNSVEVW
jgi:hypothetical protein